MMARSSKKTHRGAAKRRASPAKSHSKPKKSFFKKILTAEGWRRLMMGKKHKSK